MIMKKSKRFFSLILVITLVIMLSGCQAPDISKPDNKDTAQGTTPALDTASQAEVIEQSSTQEDFEEEYKKFLKGETVLVSDIDKKGLFRSGNKYSYDEVVKSFIDNGDTLSYELSKAFYAYIDCGNDGIKEMAVKLQYGGNDPVYEYLVLKYKDDAVHLCANESGYYRSWADINAYGYITVGGSGGANLYGWDYSFVDGNGQQKFLYSMSAESSLEEAIIPSYELPQKGLPANYEMDNYAYEDEGVCCNTYSFTEYEYSEDESKRDEYARTKFYSFVDKYDKDVAPSDEYKRIYQDLGVKIYTEAQAREMIEEHITQMGLTQDLREDISPEWINLASEGIGTYSMEAASEDDTINMLTGKWVYQNSWSEELDNLYLEIKNNADFTININYKDSYTAPGYIKGHIVLDYNDGWAPTRDRFSFYVEQSNVEAVSEKSVMEYYLIDSYTIAGNKATMVLDDVSYVESFFNVTFNDKKPIFEKEMGNVIAEGSYIYLDEPEDDYYNGGDYDYTNALMPNLTLLSETENEITDEERWFAEVGISQPEDKYTVDNYTYEFSGIEGYGDKTLLTVYNAEGKRLYTFDFHDFVYAEGYEYNPFVDRSLAYALIKDNMLYVNYYHRTYAESCPKNAYMLAINLDDGYIVWKSLPLLSNSGNFVIAGDYIITGYGFSAEDHYISLINCDTGSEEQRIPTKKSPDYFALDGNKLYVRTYSYDLVYDLKLE